MVDGHDRDKQNRQEQKMSGVAPQLLQWEECWYHFVFLVEAPTGSSVGSPVLSSGGDRPHRELVRLQHTATPNGCALPGALEIHKTRGPWRLSSHEKSHHHPVKPVLNTECVDHPKLSPEFPAGQTSPPGRHALVAHEASWKPTGARSEIFWHINLRTTSWKHAEQTGIRAAFPSK